MNDVVVVVVVNDSLIVTRMVIVGSWIILRGFVRRWRIFGVDHNLIGTDLDLFHHSSGTEDKNTNNRSYNNHHQHSNSNTNKTLIPTSST
jgi:hypothetical protein